MASRYAQFPESTEPCESLSDDDLPDYQGSDVDIHEVLAEIKDYDVQEPRQDIQKQKESYCHQPASAEADQDSDLENAIDQLKENANCHEKSCANCSNPRKVMHVSRLKKGQHILMPGQYSTKHVHKRRTLKRMYDHHAIIKEIKNTKGTCITMALIHFTSINGKIGVYEETKEYDLREKDICIVDYIFPRYDPEIIVARAESILTQRDKFKQYHIFKSNCEHFATWCVVGEGESFQVQSIRQKIINIVTRLFGVGSKIAKGILRLIFISSDEIAAGLRLAVPEFVLGGAGALYFIYCLLKTAFHFKKYKKGQICWSCLKGKLSDLWLTFGAFGLTSAITFLLLHFAVAAIPGVGIPVLVLLIIISVAFQIKVPELRKALSCPFTVDRVKVTSLEQLCIGDVVSQLYHDVKHTSIVTEVKITNDKVTEGYIRLVHYGSSGWFKTRTIVEELFKVDLETSNIYLFDCKPLSTYPVDVVVCRARSRIGETKWNAFSNRSDHVAYWAKVKLYENVMFEDSCKDEITRPLSRAKVSLSIGKRDIHHIEELKIGDVVTSDVKKGKTGILSSIRYLDDSDGRKFEIELFTYKCSSKIVSKKSYIIDLNKVSLTVQLYNDALCHSMEKRLQNARDMEGKTCTWWTTKGFIRSCIENKFEDRVKVTSLEQIAIGDVLIQRFRGIKFTSHTSIVTEVNIANDKKNMGCIRLVHYWQSALLSSKEIVEENVEFDLEKSDVYVLVRQAPAFPSNIVVNRARSRVGETKWNMLSNSSKHFAYWAKFQQYENENVNDTCDEDGRTSFSETETLQFKQTREIHHIKELSRGDVVQCQLIGNIYDTGIVSSVRSFDDKNGRKFEIEVLTCTFSGTVSCKIHTIDLTNDRLYVKIYGPEKLLSMEQRVLNAQKMKGANEFWLTTRGFIEHCLEIKPLGCIKVLRMDQIGIGDVMLQRINGFECLSHTSIVTDVKIINDNQTKGCVRHIHYAASSLCGTKEIVEEDIEVDLEKSFIYLVHSKKPSYPADDVVSRARIRIGETKWNMISNRSDHVACWAKFRQYENKTIDESCDEDGRTSLARTNSSRFPETREIHRIEDVRIGSVVKSDVFGQIHDTGILSSVLSLDDANGRKFEIKLYKCTFSRRVCCQKFTIDLKKDRLYEKLYDPVQCQSTEQRLKNARHLVNEKGLWWTTNGFIKHCVKIKSAKCGKVTSLDQIDIGNVISQRIHGIKYTSHTGIVTEVKSINDEKTKGFIRVVHYGSSALLRTREIVEEEIEVDVEQSDLYILDSKTPSFPPDVVVSRARSRIGETKWDFFSNRSFHFTHWAKYKQCEYELDDETCNEDVKTSQQRSVATRYIKQIEIHRMKDIKIGDVVKSDVIGIIDNTGIVSSVRYLDSQNKRKFEIDVFTYTFARRIIRKTYTVDLNKVRVYLDVYGPLKYQSFEQRLKNAREIEDKKGSWWTTQGFIEHCLNINSGNRVTKLDQIGIGDVISQCIRGIKFTSHTSIVTEVNIKSGDNMKGDLRVIHYGYSGLFETRQIIEEKVEIDLEKSNIYLLQCKMPSFPPCEVVCRARSRIGENKWNLFSNHSGHFACWAKFQKFEREVVEETCNEDFIASTSRLDVPFFMKTREIHRLKDIRIGDVVKSSVIGLINDTGILSSIRHLDDPNGRKFEIEVFTCSFFWAVTREKVIIDLDEDRLFVKVYNPSKCKTMEQRAQAAREFNEGSWWTTESFIRHCIELKSQ